MIWAVPLVIVLVLFLAYPREVGALLGFLVMGLVVLIFYWNHTGEQNRQKRLKERAAVMVKVSFDTEYCRKEYPLLVQIRNGGQKTVDYMHWYIEAYKPGYSSNVVMGDRRLYSSDKILKKGEGQALCYKLPYLQSGVEPSELEWLGGPGYIRFRED